MPGNLVILSGGLDSTVCMALATRDGGRPPLALTFDYGQRHRVELERARAVAEWYQAEHLVVSLDASSWGGSALTDPSIPVPDAAGPASGGPASGGPAPAGPAPGAATEAAAKEIPVTYVPARNLIFLSVAVGVAEARDLDAAYIGVNALDYSGYPDCRPEFIGAFRAVAAVAQKRALEGRPVEIRTPLMELSKADIVGLAVRLEAPIHLSWSCYRGGRTPCGRCDACVLRARGFAQAGIADPALTPGADSR